MLGQTKFEVTLHSGQALKIKLEINKIIHIDNVIIYIFIFEIEQR